MNRMASPKRQLTAIFNSKTGSDSGLGLSNSLLQTRRTHWTRQKQRFPFVVQTDCIEMGLTFPHLHSTYCLFVPLSDSLPPSSQTFVLELSPIRFQRYFYKRCRVVVCCRSSPVCPDFSRTNRWSRSDINCYGPVIADNIDNDGILLRRTLGKYDENCPRCRVLTTLLHLICFNIQTLNVELILRLEGSAIKVHFSFNFSPIYWSLIITWKLEFSSSKPDIQNSTEWQKKKKS